MLPNPRNYKLLLLCLLDDSKTKNKKEHLIGRIKKADTLTFYLVGFYACLWFHTETQQWSGRLLQTRPDESLNVFLNMFINDFSFGKAALLPCCILLVYLFNKVEMKNILYTHHLQSQSEQTIFSSAAGFLCFSLLSSSFFNNRTLFSSFASYPGGHFI